MYLLSLLTKRNERALDQLALEIARRCRSDVQQRLSVAAHAMTPHEAQGYVRSRAATLIRREATAALSRRGKLSHGTRQALVKRATDYVVPLVIRQLPSPVVAVRKAG